MTGMLETDGELGAVEPLLAVTRALEILEWLAETPEGLSFAVIRQRLGTNQGACFKILATLERCGYLFRREETGRYQLTYKLNNLGLTRLSRSRLLDIAMPPLRTLADASGELVRLAVVQRDSITWVLTVAGPHRQQHTLQIVPRARLAIGLNTHAAGKAWLATLPFERVMALFGEHGIERRTPHSLTEPEAIRADLAETRRRGYATSFEEHELNIGAIAAPVLSRDVTGQPVCVGTVSVAAPMTRLDRAALEAWAPALLACTSRLAAAWPLEVG